MVKLLEIIEALPKDKRRLLDKFMISPYFVTHEGVIKLYEHIKEGLKTGQLSNEYILRQYKHTPNAQQQLYHIGNYLTASIEQFLAIENQKENLHEQHIHTIDAYRQLRLSDAANAMYKYSERRLQAQPRRGATYFRSRYLLQQESFQLSSQQGRAKLSNIQELSDSQDISFIIEKLRTGCLLLSHEVVSKQVYEKGLLNSLLTYLDNHPFLHIPVVGAYYHGYYAQLGGDDSDSHFKQLKSLLNQHALLLSPDEIHDLYLLAVNFCIRKINQAEQSYYREIFDLYQSGLQCGAWLEDNTLSRWTFNNITAAALLLQEYDWLKVFLDEYAPFLPDNHREGALQYNLARYYYGIKNYPEAMHRLQRMEYDDVLVNLVAKIMLAKIYYELDQTDVLESHLDSIQIYIRRKKVLGYHKENYTTIIRFMRKLLSINPLQKSAVQAFRQEIVETTRMTEKDWFLRQLDLSTKP